MQHKSIVDFEARKRFMDAISNGHYLITISSFDKEKSEINHYAVFNNFPTNDIIPSLEHTNRLIFKQIPDDPKKDHTPTNTKSG
jgi:hypothetical protein